MLSVVRKPGAAVKNTIRHFFDLSYFHAPHRDFLIRFLGLRHAMYMLCCPTLGFSYKPWIYLMILTAKPESGERANVREATFAEFHFLSAG
jgi:hypothetical protein